MTSYRVPWLSMHTDDNVEPAEDLLMFGHLPAHEVESIALDRIFDIAPFIPISREEICLEEEELVACQAASMTTIQSELGHDIVSLRHGMRENFPHTT